MIKVMVSFSALMIFDLFYNQFVQIIDSVELAGGAIFRTLLTDYDLPIAGESASVGNCLRVTRSRIRCAGLRSGR